MEKRVLGTGGLKVSALRLRCMSMSHGKPWIVPIPVTTKLNRLEENLGAMNVVLNPDDLRQIDQAELQITVQGARYTEAGERLTGR